MRAVGDLVAARSGWPVKLPDLAIVYSRRKRRSPTSVPSPSGCSARSLLRCRAWRWRCRQQVLPSSGRPEHYDALSFAFALLASGVGTPNMAYATGYMAHGHAHRFYAAFSLLIAGLIGMAGSLRLLQLLRLLGVDEQLGTLRCAGA